MSESRRNGRGPRPAKPANDVTADKAHRRTAKKAQRAEARDAALPLHKKVSRFLRTGFRALTGGRK